MVSKKHLHSVKCNPPFLGFHNIMHANKTKENKKFSVEGKKRESKNEIAPQRFELSWQVVPFDTERLK